MPAETITPKTFAELITSPSYPTWAKPEPADNPTKHRKTYTFLRSIANTWDTLVGAAQTAAESHVATTAPDDALDALGVTFGKLTRALRDTTSTYRAYLKNPLDRWYKFGTVEGLKEELAHLGYTETWVVSWRDLVDAGAAPGNVVFGGNDTFFYVGIRAPGLLGPPTTKWKTSGAKWKTSGVSWGGSPIGFGAYIDEIRRVIAMCKPAHTSCRFICVFADSLSGPGVTMLPNGTFHIYPCNEPWERIRPGYAFNPYYTVTPLVP